MAHAKAAVTRIESLTGMRLSESQSRRTLRKLGPRYRKAASARQVRRSVAVRVLPERDAAKACGSGPGAAQGVLRGGGALRDGSVLGHGEFRHAIDDCLAKMSRERLPEVETLPTLNFQFFPSHKTS